MRNRGFSLLEVLIVVSMLAIVAATVTLSFSGESAEEQITKQAQRFSVVFGLVSEYAILNQRQMGLFIEGNSYRFVSLNDDDKWEFVEGERMFEPVEFSDPVKISLQLDDLPWQNKDNFFDNKLFDEELSFEQDKQDKEPFPQVLILPSGEITPFRLRFDVTPLSPQDKPVTVVVDGEDEIPLNTHLLDAES